jgi:predicted RND superfamily exporter protein
MSHEVEVSAFNRRLVGFITGRPVLSLLLGLALVALMVMGLGRVRADFTHRGFFWDDDPHLQRFDAFERRFGNDDAVVIAVHSPSGIFDMESAALLQKLTDGMWQIPDVIRVDSLANYNWIHAEADEIKVEPLLPETLTPQVLEERKAVALAHEVLPSYLVSRDAKTAVLMAFIKPGLDQPPDVLAITASSQKLIDSLKGGDHQFYMTGGPAVVTAFKEVAEKDMGRLLPIAVLVAVIVLSFTLRSIAGVFLPLLLMAMSIVGVFGFAGWAGVTLTNMTTTVPSIMLATCIGDAVHVLVTYFVARRRGLERRQAASYSLSKNLLPSFLTSLTVSIGFLSFATSNMKPISGLGFLVGFGALFAWVLTYLILGALLALLPIRAGRVDEESGSRDRRLADRWVGFLARNRKAVAAGAVVISVVSIAVASRNEVNSDPFKYFDKAVPVRVANEFIEAAVGGARNIEVVIDAGVEDGIKDPAFLGKVAALQDAVQQMPGVTRAISIVDILKATNRALNGDQPGFYRLADDRETLSQELFLYTMNLPRGMDLNDRVTIKNDALRMTVLWTLPTSKETLAAIRQIEGKARELGLSAHVTGKYFLYNSQNEEVVLSFLWSFLPATLSIAITLLLALRSFKLGLLAMIPNVIPVLMGGAFLKLLGQPLDMGTVIVASVTLGIAVDDTIHVLANFRRHQAQGMDAMSSVSEVFAHTARPLITTTVILALSFGAFLTADYTPNVYFGLLTALILTFALLTDLVVTPVLLVWRQAALASAKAPAELGAGKA